MKIKIYRGTHQIGGCITEITTEKTRIIIDFGTVLPYRNGKMPKENLVIEGVTYIGHRNCDGILFTHYHGDHTGLLDKAIKGIPMYMGKAAKKIFLLSQAHKNSDSVARIEQIREYEDGKSFSIGDIKITPILTDHSAFDAYMLLIEADGKQVLHTGDFRTHGVKGEMVIPRLAKLRGLVDVMITEGTNLSYTNPVVTSEYLLAEAAETLMERYPYVFVMCGATYIDRLAAFHKASERKNLFLCDAYQMSLLETAAEYGAALTDFYRFDRTRVYFEEMEGVKDGFCMAVRNEKDFSEIMKPYREKHNEQTLIIYAMSEGYLSKHHQAIEKLTSGFRYIIKLHTSGHASEEAIWAAANTVSAKKIIPIHTENPEKIRLGALQDRVVFLEDDEEFNV